MARNVTEWILDHSKLKTEPEVTPNGQAYSMYNTGGVETEVGELLYSLVRCWKPELIVETGTHLGISSAYMAQACLDNKKGKVKTYEVIKSLQDQAVELWKGLGVDQRVEAVLKPSLKAKHEGPIDFLFLDSEPQYRFAEFLKFWPSVRQGGIIAIHDLHRSLGRSNLTAHGMEHWPYGDWVPQLGDLVSSFQVQMLHVPNPRGMVLFQRTRRGDENVRHLRDTYFDC